MATHTTLTSLFSDIANSIRSKTGSSEQIVADNFPTAISQIPTDPSGECTATDADSLFGKTAYAGNQLRTGVIPYYNSEIIQPFAGLCFTANTAGSTINMIVNGSPTLNQNFSYSMDKIIWNDFIPGTTTVTLTNIGDKVYFKGNNPSGISENWSTGYKFSMTGSIAASGNIMSLIDNGACTCLSIPNDYYFDNLFADCDALTTPPELPATTLTMYCYEALFYGCTNLVTAPSLPASTMQYACYIFMFTSCTSLATPPALPATILAEGCYESMFDSCNSLIVSDTSGSGYSNIWKIPISGTFSNTYRQNSMFNGCDGTRSSDNMAGAARQSYTYYTQNAPV